MKKEPTDHQAARIAQVSSWYFSETGEPLKFGGYAGTGKTTVLQLLPEILRIDPQNILYLTPTNKARLVLQMKLDEGGEGCRVYTLHSSVYTAKTYHCSRCPLYGHARQFAVCHTDNPFAECGCDLEFNPKTSTRSYDLVVVDEASMVAYKDFLALMDFAGNTKVLFVGDHGQLPPVELDETLKHFGLMNHPDVRLEEPMRFAQDSPIHKLATLARTGNGHIDYGVYGPGVQKIKNRPFPDLSQFSPDKTMFITYHRNEPTYDQDVQWNVAYLNEHIRGLHGFTGQLPQVGEKVIALRVKRRMQVPRGCLGYIKRIRHNYGGHREQHYAVIDLPEYGQTYEGLIAAQQFNNIREVNGQHELDLWDFGYCNTCHAAQGSEYESVVIFEPSKKIRYNPVMNYPRWLYTAITRATRNLTIIG